MKTSLLRHVTAATLACLVASTAGAGVVRVGSGAFAPGASVITFGELPLDTRNPVYTPDMYGGGAGAPDVQFEGYFLGQHPSGDPVTDCPGSTIGCVAGMPAGPLALDSAAPDTYVSYDSAAHTNPVLSGTPIFGGPIAILFSTDQAGVGFDAGFFDGYSTTMKAYARDGTLLGSLTNDADGLQFMGLAMDDGSARIAGVLIGVYGSEPAGFAIDNLHFGDAGQVSAVPEPGMWLLLAAGLPLLRLARRSV